MLSQVLGSHLEYNFRLIYMIDIYILYFGIQIELWHIFFLVKLKRDVFSSSYGWGAIGPFHHWLK